MTQSSAQTDDRRRFSGLDGLRALGALAILATHVGFQTGAALHGPFSALLARLDSGVAVFFVISGFLLYRPYVAARLSARPAPRTGSYFWHRALRILPVVWIAVVLAIVVTPPAERATPWAYLQHALMIQIYGSDTIVAGLTQLWSLATEVAFYLVLPLLARVLGRRAGSDRSWVRTRLLALAALMVVSPAWMAGATALGHTLPRLWLPGFVGWFAAGMALAVWHTARSRGLLGAGLPDALAEAPGTVWAGALAIYALLMTPLAGPLDLSEPSPFQALVKNAGYLAFAALVVFPAVAALHESDEPAAVRRLGGRVGHFLGNISYGVFAYHVAILLAVQRFTRHELFSGGYGELFFLTLALSLVTATLSYYLIERPLLRRGRRQPHYEVSPSPTAGSTAEEEEPQASQLTAMATAKRTQP